MDIIELMLLGLLLVCGIATCLSKNLLVSLVIYMAYSVIMSIIWALLEAPDLASRCELLVQLMQFFGRRPGDDDRVTLQ